MVTVLESLKRVLPPAEAEYAKTVLELVVVTLFGAWIIYSLAFHGGKAFVWSARTAQNVV
jgi:hypothetical protein